MTYGNIASLKSGLPSWFADDLLIGQLDGKALYAGDLRALIARAESKKEEAVKVEPLSTYSIARLTALSIERSPFSLTREEWAGLMARMTVAEAEAKRLREALELAQQIVVSVASEGWPDVDLYLHGVKVPARALPSRLIADICRLEGVFDEALTPAGAGKEDSRA